LLQPSPAGGRCLLCDIQHDVAATHWVFTDAHWVYTDPQAQATPLPKATGLAAPSAAEAEASAAAPPAAVHPPTQPQDHPQAHPPDHQDPPAAPEPALPAPHQAPLMMTE